MRVWAWRGVLLLLGLTAMLFAAGRAVPHLGRWLVVEDPLQRVDAIVVLGGNLPFRSAEAARLYREGWGSEVWITAPEGAAEVEAVRQLGLGDVPKQDLSRRVLEKFGVSPKAIRILSPRAGNTIYEIGLTKAGLKRSGGHKVIFVTSKAHTRRVRILWSMLASGNEEAIVRPIQRDPFDADHWQSTGRDRSTVEHEVQGILYAMFGLPLLGGVRN